MEFSVDKDGILIKPRLHNEEKITIPKNTKIICDSAFHCWENLEEVTLPSNLIGLDRNAFFGCRRLKEINLPDSLQFMKESIFSFCTSLKSIKLPDSITGIDNGCFKHCTSLRNLTFSPNIEYIDNEAFAYCIRLEKIIIPPKTKNIGYSCFYGCTNLTNVELPPAIGKISNSCFKECEELETIDIPNKVTLIDNYAFWGCKNLKTISLPPSLTTIKENSFDWCYKVENLSLYNYQNLLESGLHDALKNLKYFYIDKKTKELICRKESISNKRYKPINYLPIMQLFSCSKEIAVILSLHFNIDDIKKQKLEFIKPIISKLLKEPNYQEILTKIINNKEFIKLINRLNLDNESLYPLFKFAYNLGAFNTNFVDRQKATEFIFNLFSKDILTSQKVNNMFSEIEIKSFNQEWVDFITNKDVYSALFARLGSDLNANYIAKIYNHFNNIKEFSRSNKGSQQYKKITLSSCERYFNKTKFDGITADTCDIAEIFSKFDYEQAHFDEAKSIREEYLKLKEENKIHDHLIEDIPIRETLKEIENERGKILSNMREIIKSLCKSNNQFTYEFLSKYDAVNFILGKYCSSCAHLDAAGKGITIASILHPDCQNLVIKDKEGKIIAKSTIYINRNEGYGLLNTIKINNKLDVNAKKDIYKKFNEAIKVFANKYNKKNPTNPLKQINVGIHSNDLEEEILIHTKNSPIILKGINFSSYNNNSFSYNGDWEGKQNILWKKNYFN